MAKDDYWVVVYKLLNYYYLKMKRGEPIDEAEIDAHVLGISNPYLLDVYRNLFQDGFLTGLKVTTDGTGRSYVEDFEMVRITTKVVEYLEGNSKMAQVYRVLKEIKDWIPGLS